MKFRLNKYIKAPYLLNVIEVDGDSRTRKRYSFEPNTLYDTQDLKKVPNILTLIDSTLSWIVYKPEALEEIKKLGASYSLEGCKSCGGRLTRIKLKVFEEVTDED